MSLEIVNLLIEYEMTMSRLYKVCAETFPELTEFWQELSDEEVRHADNIRELMVEASNKAVTLNQKRFNIRPIEISMEHALDTTRRVKEKEVDLIGILSLAYDIEMSLIESKYYEIFSGKSREINDRLKKVRNESREHARRIDEMKQKTYNTPGEYS